MRRLSWCSGGGAAPEAAAAREAVAESPRFVTSHYARFGDTDAATGELAWRVVESCGGARKPPAARSEASCREASRRDSSRLYAAGCFECLGAGAAGQGRRDELAADALALFNALLQDTGGAGSWDGVELEKILFRMQG
jgi:hypothetical protein